MKVAIVNYGMGNLRSVANAIEAVGGVQQIVDDPASLRSATHIILPGVGAFGEAMNRLRAAGFVDALEELVLGRRLPFLGICLGMQLLATRGFEHGDHQGLGWIAGEVRPLETSAEVRVPHMGWNGLEIVRGSPLLDGIGRDATFYFVHSFHHVPTAKEHVIAQTDHGGPVTAVVQRENIFGTQFHPEKSQQPGLTLLKNFLSFAS
jgi:glutamine amidotransferase